MISRPLVLITIISVLTAGLEDLEDEVLAGKRPMPGLRLQLVAPRRSFEMGEPIALTMRYTYSGDRPLSIDVIHYDRSGRIPNFGFRAVDERGQAVRDPLPWTGGIMGGLRGAERLAKDKPFAQEVTLNEWLCFDRPGRYTVTATSGIVHLDESGRLHGGPVIPLEGEPLEIVIIAPDDRRRRERLARDAADLRGEDRETRERAMRDLRFMVDPRAIPLLVRGLGADDDNTGIEAQFGMLSFRDLGPVKAEVLRLLDAEPRRIAPDLIWRYSSILAEADLRARGAHADRYSEAFREAEKPWVEQLSRKFRERLATLPPREAAEATIQGLAFGPVLSPSDAENWRRILDNAEGLDAEKQAHAAMLIGEGCRNRELIPALAKVATNARLDPRLRSAAIVALHVMGDDSPRDLVAADLMAPAPIFSAEAHETLGDYKADEISRKLVTLIETGGGDVRESAANRLRDFGTDRARELVELLRRGAGEFATTRAALLEALVGRSPEDAVPFLRDVLQAPGPEFDRGLRQTASLLACRIDSPAAQELVRQQLRAGSEGDREAQAEAIGRAWQEDENARDRPHLGEVGHDPRRWPPADRSVAGSFVPELLALARTDPSERVKASAGEALAAIARIPKSGVQPMSRSQRERCIPPWEDWWRANGARFGRWGREWRGLALKCSADRGEYAPGEPITLTLRIRRLAGDDLARAPLRLRGRSLGQGQEPPRRWDVILADPPASVPAGPPGSESRVQVAIPKDAGFDRAGTFTFAVEAVPGTEDPPPGDDVPRSDPLTITVRPVPKE